MEDIGRQLTFTFKANMMKFKITSVYARCNALKRLELWDELEALADNIEVPWLIGGDFNVILIEEEK